MRSRDTRAQRSTATPLATGSLTNRGDADIDNPRGSAARAWVTSGRLQGLGVGLIVLALVSMLGASLITNRANTNDRERLAEEVGPLALALERLQQTVALASVEARGYALTGDGTLLSRFAAASVSYDLALEDFTQSAENAGQEDDAADIVALAEAYIVVPQNVVAARDRGDEAAVAELVRDGPTLLDAFTDRTETLRGELRQESAELRSRIGDAQGREQFVLVLAAVAGIAAAVTLVWWASRNLRLTGNIEAQRALLTNVVSNVPGVVWESWGRPDAATQRIDFVSSHVEAMLGYTVDEWLSTPNFWLTIVHPDDRDTAAAAATATYEAKGSGANQFRWVARDGRVLDVLAHSSVILDERGVAVGMRGVTLDVTEQKRAEASLRFSVEASNILFSSLDQPLTLENLAQFAVPRLADWCAVHLVDEHGVAQQVAVAHIDPAKVRWAHELQRRYPPDPNAATGVPNIIRTGKPEMLTEIPDSLLVAAAEDEEHLRIMRELGFTSYLSVPMIARGRVLGAITLVAAESGRRLGDDDLRLAQDLALRASVAVDNARLYTEAEHERARMASVIASVSHGMYQLDQADRIVFLNPAAQRLLGTEPGALIGMEVHAALHGADVIHEGACPLGALGGQVDAWQDQFVCADGRRIDVEVSISHVLLVGRTVGAVSVFQDVSERLRQEQMKDDFIAFASHELRSPLTTVSGMAKWLEKYALRRPDLFDEDSRDAIETMSSGADRMANTIELFLDLTRIESNRLVVDLDSVDYVAIVRQECEALSMRHPAADLDCVLPEEPLWGESDANRLRQVLSNILDNAVKYGGEPARVTVRATAADSRALITVRDNGSGIPEGERTQVFDRFYRAQAHEGTRKPGLGIGLFISKQLVVRLGGRLSFVTASDGTEFRIEMPLQ